MNYIYRYPDDVNDFIRAHAGEYAIRDMAEKVNELFGTEFTMQKMRSYYKNHNLHALPRKGRKRPEIKITTPEMDAFILANYVGTGHQAMADLVNERFGTAFTKEQIKAYYARNKLNSGLTGYYPKGHTPDNKGKKLRPDIYEKCKGTMFKKGHVPHNTHPVGTEIASSSDGYIYVKVKDDPKAKRAENWLPKQQIVWEEHYGKVPKGSIVIFKDGNIENFDISNLACITREENARLNKNHLRSEDPALTEVGINIAKLTTVARKRQIKEKNGGNKHDQRDRTI